MQDPLPWKREGRIGEDARHAAASLGQLGRQVLLQEGADFVAKNEVGGLKIEIHA
jgi:hypothetical protein